MKFFGEIFNKKRNSDENLKLKYRGVTIQGIFTFNVLLFCEKSYRIIKFIVLIIMWKLVYLHNIMF